MSNSVRIPIVIAVLLGGLLADRLYALAGRYEEMDVTDGGTIVGVVRFEGTVPKPKKFDVSKSKDPPCHEGPIFSEDLVVSEDGKVQWAVASIQKIPAGKPFPKEDADNPVTLDQHGCRFAPHVLVVPQRRMLRILNSDGILHNVHVNAKKNRSLNRAMPPKVKKMDVSFKRPERIRFSCDVHDWMGAWIVVAGHPYHAVTGSDGTFRLENVPAGAHTVEVWHETLGRQTQQVTVTPGEEARVEFVFKK